MHIFMLLNHLWKHNGEAEVGAHGISVLVIFEHLTCTVYVLQMNYSH